MEQKIQLPWEDWEIVKVLGTGGFGSVYEIQREVTGGCLKAAVKILSIPRDTDEITQLRAEGYDEASISAHYRDTLKEIIQEYSFMMEVKGNTNVVACDDLRYTPHENGIGWDIFIKMELLHPLNKTKNTAYQEADVIRMGIDLCNALTLCRQKGIVHRDIKPANIFISDRGEYKLGDFGIAKYSDRTTQGTRIGTYEFMAPEVYNNRPYGTAADIYCLGLVLYWMMNERRTPFLPLPPQIPSGSDRERAGAMRYNGHPLPPPAHGSEALKQIVLRACAFAPEHRFSCAEEFGQALAKLERAARSVVVPAAASGHDFDDIFGNSGPLPPQQPQPPQPANPPVRPAAPAYAPPVYAATPAPKKKSKTVPIVLGSVAAALVLIVAIVLIAVAAAPKNGWVSEGGERYYYINGTPSTGWTSIDGALYYFNSDGTLPERVSTLITIEDSHSEEKVDFETQSGLTLNTNYKVLDTPVENCIAFEYDIKLTNITVGTGEGDWSLYIYVPGTGWSKVKTFTMYGNSAHVYVNLNIPTDFSAYICVYEDISEGCSLNFEHDITEVQYIEVE